MAQATASDTQVLSISTGLQTDTALIARPVEVGFFFFSLYILKCPCGYSENDAKFPESQTGSKLFSKYLIARKEKR